MLSSLYWSVKDQAAECWYFWVSLRYRQVKYILLGKRSLWLLKYKQAMSSYDNLVKKKKQGTKTSSQGTVWNGNRSPSSTWPLLWLAINVAFISGSEGTSAGRMEADVCQSSTVAPAWPTTIILNTTSYFCTLKVLKWCSSTCHWLSFKQGLATKSSHSRFLSDHSSQEFRVVNKIPLSSLGAIWIPWHQQMQQVQSETLGWGGISSPRSSGSPT